MIIKLFKSAILSCIITGQCIAMNLNQIDDIENTIPTITKTIASFKKDKKIEKYYITEDKAGIVTSDGQELEYEVVPFMVAIPENMLLMLFVTCIKGIFEIKYPNKQFKFRFNSDFIEHIDCHVNTKNNTNKKFYQDASTNRGGKSQINVAAFCKELSETHINSPTVQLFKEFAKVLKSENNVIDKNTYIRFMFTFFKSIQTLVTANFPLDLNGNQVFSIEMSVLEAQNLNLRFAFNGIKETETVYEVDVGSLYPVTDTKITNNLQTNPDKNSKYNKKDDTKEMVNFVETYKCSFSPNKFGDLLYMFVDLKTRKVINKEQIDSLAIGVGKFLKDQLENYKADKNNVFFENPSENSLSSYLRNWFYICNEASDSSIFREAVLDYILNGGRQNLSIFSKRNKLPIFSKSEIKRIDRILGRDTLMPFALITCILKERGLPTDHAEERFADDLFVENKLEEFPYNFSKFNSNLTNGWFYKLLFPDFNLKEVKHPLSTLTRLLLFFGFNFDLTKAKLNKSSLIELKNSMNNLFDNILKGKHILLDRSLEQNYVEIDNILRVIYPEHSFFDFYSEEGGFKYIDEVKNSGDANKINKIDISTNFAAVFMSICAQIDLLTEKKTRYLGSNKKRLWIERIENATSKDKGIEKQLCDLAIKLLKTPSGCDKNGILTDDAYATFKRNLHNVLETAYKTLLEDDTIKPIMYKKPDTQILSDNPTQQENNSEIMNETAAATQSSASSSIQQGDHSGEQSALATALLPAPYSKNQREKNLEFIKKIDNARKDSSASSERQGNVVDVLDEESYRIERQRKQWEIRNVAKATKKTQYKANRKK